MRLPRRGQRGFTLIELLIVVAILGILAAVVIPNVGRFLGRGQEEARRAEFHDVSTALTALMTENNLSAIPTPYATNDSPCTLGTKDMTKYPDNTAALTVKALKLGGTWAAPDKVGFMLYDHDMTGNTSATPVVNYVNFSHTTYCYTVTTDGTVYQYNTSGTPQTQ